MVRLRMRSRCHQIGRSIDWLFCYPVQYASVVLEALANPECGWYFFKNSDMYRRIPGAPIAYWSSDKCSLAFAQGQALDKLMPSSVGIQTGDNNRFVRYWWEPSRVKFISPDQLSRGVDSVCVKWFAYNKGGEYRKWYGNDDSVINWAKNGAEAKRLRPGETRHYQDYKDELKFSPLITWSRISSGAPAFRYKQEGFLSDMAGFGMYPRKRLPTILAFCNSSVGDSILRFLASTLNYMIGDVMKLPLLDTSQHESQINDDAYRCIVLSKEEWDSSERSWCFKRHPLV